MDIVAKGKDIDYGRAKRSDTPFKTKPVLGDGFSIAVDYVVTAPETPKALPSPVMLRKGKVAASTLG